jgi:hypothetical protein
MEKLELFQQGKLRGGELSDILRHLEDCDYCFHHLPPQDPEEILKRIFKKEKDEDDSITDIDKFLN